MAHQQWQGSHSYYTAWNSQYNNNQQQPYPYNHSQHEQYDPSYPYYYPQQQQHVQEQYPYTTASSQPPPPHSSVIHQLHEQTQHQQALGALAAASITTALQGGQNNSAMWYSHQQQPTQAYTQHHHYPPQRAIVAYNDLEPAPAPSRPQGSFCCNRWYRTQAAKEQHERNHIQCNMCSFSGIKAVMDEHMEIEHGKIPPEGSSRKKNKPDGIVPPNAPKINTPEELTAWIEARKRNWPTKANIERKQREEAERAARGQLPKESDKKRKRKDDANVDSNKVPKMESMNVLGAYGSDDDDDDGESDSDTSVDIERDAVTAKDPTAMGKISLPSEQKPRTGPRCRFFARGHCRNGNKCRYVHEKPTQQQHAKRTQAPPMEEKRPTLLRMLLAKEIKEEQNVILQCFRYIVDNQFFGRS